MAMTFPGKPAEPKAEPRSKRVYIIETEDDTPDEIHADYMRSDDGLVSFWQNNEPHDILEVAYPLHRIHSIVQLTKGDS